MANKTLLNDLKDSDFQLLVNNQFSSIQNETAQESFELLEVSRIGSEPQGDTRHPFSLLFRGSHTDSPVQSVYHLEHPKLGQLDLFLVPIGSDEAGIRYEAIFT
jgi:hypothetical protein